MVRFFVSSHVSKVHMSEADLLWECIMIRDKVFQLPDWFMPSNVCQIINYVSCGEGLICAFYCIISILCVFLYFVLNFLHCSTGQKLMLLGRCIGYSIFYFFLLFFIFYCVPCVRFHNKQIRPNYQSQPPLMGFIYTGP